MCTQCNVIMTSQSVQDEPDQRIIDKAIKQCIGAPT